MNGIEERIVFFEQQRNDQIGPILMAAMLRGELTEAQTPEEKVNLSSLGTGESITILRSAIVDPRELAKDPVKLQEAKRRYLSPMLAIAVSMEMGIVM